MQVESARSKALPGFPKLEALAMALVSFVLLQGFRTQYLESKAFAWIESAVYLVIPFVVLALVSRQWLSDHRPPSKRPLYFLLQAGVVLFAALPIPIQLLARQFGVGDSYEVWFLLCAQNAALFLLVHSIVPGFERVGFVVSCAVVLFVSCSAESAYLFVAAFLFGMIAMWWLIGNYWSQLQTKTIDGSSRALKIKGFPLVVSIALVATAGAIAWWVGPSQEAYSLKGFMPTSGGEGYGDDFARSGVGDGNMLAAGEDPDTVGAVDTNKFIEDDKPSIYDMQSEHYDAPKSFNPKRNQAQTLDELAKDLHNVKQSELEGKTFRTVRESSNRVKKELEDRMTEALFFVEGSLPARFGVASYNHFDGVDWKKTEIDWRDLHSQLILLQHRRGQTWFTLNAPERNFLTDSRQHKVKMMRLETKAIPSPPLMSAWHIFRVKKKGLFDWSQDVMVHYQGEYIPEQTVIDIHSYVPNYHFLRERPITLKGKSERADVMDYVDEFMGVSNGGGREGRDGTSNHQPEESDYTQLPDEAVVERLRLLAAEWTVGVDRGWNQVETIVNRFRDEYKHDPTNVPPEDCDSPIGYFLDEKSGPSYLFASTAVLMLRAAGYEARLTSGFVVQEEDFVATANQSIVTSDNLHMWPEVRLEKSHWLPLEPTPTYPIPYSTQTYWQWARGHLRLAAGWVKANPILTSLAVCFVFCLVWFRKDIEAFCCRAVWQITNWLAPNRVLSSTRWLIDRRFRLAGRPRPQHALVSEWFGQLDQASAREFSNLWNLAMFGPASQASDSGFRQIARAASREIESQLSFGQIKKYAKGFHGKRHNTGD